MKFTLVTIFLGLSIVSFIAYTIHSMNYCAKPVCTISYLDYSLNSHTVERHFIWKNSNWPYNNYGFSLPCSDAKSPEEIKICSGK